MAQAPSLCPDKGKRSGGLKIGHHACCILKGTRLENVSTHPTRVHLREVEWRPWHTNVIFYRLVWQLHCDSSCHTLLPFQMSRFIYHYESCIMRAGLELYLNVAILDGLWSLICFIAGTVTKS